MTLLIYNNKQKKSSPFYASHLDSDNDMKIFVHNYFVNILYWKKMSCQICVLSVIVNRKGLAVYNLYQTNIQWS